MKNLWMVVLLVSLTFGAYAQTKKKITGEPIHNKVVEIACGECQFKMKGKDCELTVKIDGKPYFVDGKGIDDFGDAHGKHGFCNAVSKAEVSGEIVNNRFKASSIKLLPAGK